jgi:hypothetical protein
MKGAVMEFAETLMFVGVVGRHFVGESEKEESEGLARDEIEAGFLGAMNMGLGCTRAARGSGGLLHLFESVYDGWMKLVLVG